jgi:hypothetical protein
MKPDTTGGAWVWLVAIFFFPALFLAVVFFAIIVYLCEIIVEAIRTLTKGWW